MNKIVKLLIPAGILALAVVSGGCASYYRAYNGYGYSYPTTTYSTGSTVYSSDTVYETSPTVYSGATTYTTGSSVVVPATGVTTIYEETYYDPWFDRPYIIGGGIRPIHGHHHADRRPPPPSHHGGPSGHGKPPPKASRPAHQTTGGLKAPSRPASPPPRMNTTRSSGPRPTVSRPASRPATSRPVSRPSGGGGGHRRR